MFGNRLFNKLRIDTEYLGHIEDCGDPDEDLYGCTCLTWDFLTLCSAIKDPNAIDINKLAPCIKEVFLELLEEPEEEVFLELLEEPEEEVLIF